MTFLNLMLLGGTAAMVAPLVIHLLNRSRFQLLDWGAMHLLESAVKINSRRVQWRAWLLLLLRMLIPALLAMCLARPVLTAWKAMTGGGASSFVVVIDNSLSMEGAASHTLPPRPSTSNLSAGNLSVGNTSGAAPRAVRSGSAFEAALAEAADLIERAGASSEWMILSSGGGAVQQASGASFDKQRAVQRVRGIEVGAGPSPWPSVLGEGLALLQRSQQPRRHLIVLSDFQRSEWDAVPPEALTALRPQADDPAVSTTITLLPIAHRGRENLSLHIDRPAGASVVTVGQTLEVRATVRNHGEAKLAGVPVLFSVDGARLATKNVDVGGRSQVVLVFQCRLDGLGSHLLEVKLDEMAARRAAGEELSAVVSSDDLDRWAVEVIEPVEVLLVEDARGTDSALSDGTFLNFALSPYAVSVAAASTNELTAGLAEATAGVDPIRCRTVEPRELTDRVLGTTRVVALVDVAQLEPAIAERLVHFVRGGGALLVFPGAALDPQWYNQNWGSGAVERLLPLDFGQQVKLDPASQNVRKIQLQTFNHPALALFNRSSNGRLDAIDFQRWYQLGTNSQPSSGPASELRSEAGPEPVSELRSESSAAGTAQAGAVATVASEGLTLLRLDNGDPLLVEAVVGRGRVLQWASSCGDRWSNMPLREVFVPLMQQVVLSSATSGAPQMNVLTGQSLTATLKESVTESLADSLTMAGGAAQPASAASAGTAVETGSATAPRIQPVSAASGAASGGGAADALRTVEVLAPGDRRYRVETRPVEGGRTFGFQRTQFPGAYWVSGVRERPLLYSVSVSEQESELAALEGDARRALAERLGADVHTSAAAFWEAERVKQTGKEIYRLLLVALVACLFLELFLQQSLTRPNS
jgi:hypothetical protein